MHHRSRTSVCQYLVPLAATCLTATVTWGSTLTLLGITGDPAPEQQGTLTAFGVPVLNDVGAIAYHALVANDPNGLSPGIGIVYRAGSEYSLLARVGRLDAQNKSFSAFDTNRLSLSNNGYVMGAANYDGKGGAYRWSTQGVETIYQEGMVNSAGGTLAGIAHPTLNGAGDAAFWGGFNNPIEGGVYTVDRGGPRTAQLLVNGPAPEGGTISFVSPSPTWNMAGTIAVMGRVTTTNPDATVNTLFRIDESGVHDWIHVGDMLSPQATLLTMDNYSNLNEAGQIAIYASQASTTAAEGMYLLDSQGARQISTRNLPAGANPSSQGILALGDGGQLLMRATHRLQGLDRQAYYVADGAGGVNLVALEGGPAPGLNGKFITQLFPSATSINARGDSVFAAGISTVNSGRPAESHLYFFDYATKSTERILGAGDSLADGIVSSIGFFGSIETVGLSKPNIHASGFNNRSDVAFFFALRDGRNGIAKWSPSSPADFNDDGSVDAVDAGILFSAWETDNSSVDLNQDGVIDGADAGMLFAEWTGDVAPLPEPAPLHGILALLLPFAKRFSRNSVWR